MRDSHLIRKLLKAGMSMRKIATLAVCSHGSVSAEKKAILREEAGIKLNAAAVDSYSDDRGEKLLAAAAVPSSQ